MTAPTHDTLHPAIRMMLAAILALSITLAHAFEPCGSLQNAYGPFDYRTQRHKLEIVEAYHFDEGVESLQRGKSGRLGGDIDYTLRASPNHPRALMAMTRLAQREKTEKPQSANYSVACYFDRAVRFAPDDATVRTLFAVYLNKKGQKTKAIEQLKAAEKYAGRSANVAYNMGLVYLDLNDFENALKYARIAYDGGFPLPGLRNRLKRAGKWRDPASKPAAANDPPTAESTNQPTNE